MDLNELLHAHQVEVMRASASGDDERQRSHFDKVALYAERIRELRSSLQMASPPAVADSHETIIYGTYAGDPEPDQFAASPDFWERNAWESEGGSLDPPQVPLPSGITTSLCREYHVGPYVYHDLSLAMAEYRRRKPVETSEVT